MAKHLLETEADHALGLARRRFRGGLVRIEGNDRRADPYRYYLPEKLEEWNKDRMYQLNQNIAENLKALHKQFGRRSA